MVLGPTNNPWNENLKTPTDYTKTKICCYCAKSVTLSKVRVFDNGVFCSKKCEDIVKLMIYKNGK